MNRSDAGTRRLRASGLIAALLVLLGACEHRRFDAKAFRDADEYDRIAMARDFVQSAGPEQYRADELVAMLGPPSFESDTWTWWLSPSHTLVDRKPGQRPERARFDVSFCGDKVVSTSTNIKKDAVHPDASTSFEDWRSRRASRAYLIEQLVTGKALEGWSRQDVRVLLGRPDLAFGHEFVWWVGRGLCDDWMLDVYVGDDGCVAYADVHLS